VEKTTNEKWFLEQLPFLRKEGARISEDWLAIWRNWY
jgi:hypothetical protein